MNLIDQTDSYDKIYEWFDILFEMKIIISVFVIMPNHFHFILFYNNQKIPLNKIIDNGNKIFNTSIAVIK
jgi:REP element-mobilizing transposase RayT